MSDKVYKKIYRSATIMFNCFQSVEIKENGSSFSDNFY